MRDRILHRVVVPAVVAMSALPVASAQAISFGPNLGTATPDNTWSCGVAGGNSGCTVEDPLTTSMSLVLPDPIVHGNQTGIVTALHVLSAATAPAQFIVVEWAAHPSVPGSSFPGGVSAVTQQVTLHPGLNNFNTYLPVDYTFESTGFVRWSVVALNILNGTSPVPGWTQAPSLPGEYGLNGETGLLFNNGLPLTTTVADLTAPPNYVVVSGFQPMRLLMSGDVTITTAAGGGGTPLGHLPAPGAGLNLAGVDPVLLQRPVTIGRATNPPTVRTQETLTVPQGGGAADAKASAKSRTIVIARGSTTVPSGNTVKLVVQLTPAGKKLLRKRHHLKATLTVVATGASGNHQTVRRTITLRLNHR